MKNTLENVRISQLGVFIERAYKEYDLSKLKDPEVLAKLISEEYSLDCKKEDIINYYKIGELQIPSEYESRAIEYNININF